MRFVVLMSLLAITGIACSQEPGKKNFAVSANSKTVCKPLKQDIADNAEEPRTDVKAKTGKQTPAIHNGIKDKANRNTPDKQEKGAVKGKNPVVTTTVASEKKQVVAKKKQAVAAKKTQKGKQAAMAGETRKKKIKNARPNAQKKKVQRKKPDTGRYIALKTNVPFQVLSVHNLAVEFQVHKHVSIDFPVMWSISDIEREHAVRGIAFQPEGRWWLKKAGTGHFFGLHAHAAWFNLKWEANRYQTEHRPLLGAGISYGYKLPISSHWGAEFSIGAGYANMKYNTYYNIENGAMLNKRIRHYWGITRAGISLVYRF